MTLQNPAESHWENVHFITGLNVDEWQMLIASSLVVVAFQRKFNANVINEKLIELHGLPWWPLIPRCILAHAADAAADVAAADVAAAYVADVAADVGASAAATAAS